MIARGIDLRMRNDNHEIRRLADIIDYLAEHLSLSPQAAFRLNLALDELITNTIAYGYPAQETGRIDVQIRRLEDGVEVTLADDAIAFDPLSAPDPDLTSGVEERPLGGLGVHFVRTLMDEVSYQRVADQNLLTLTLRVDPAEGAQNAA